MRKKTRETGYTLTELMVTIVIMVVLTAVAISQLSNTNRKSIVSNTKSLLADLALAQAKALNDCSHVILFTKDAGPPAIYSYQIKRFPEDYCDEETYNQAWTYTNISSVKKLSDNLKVVEGRGFTTGASGSDSIVFTANGLPKGGYSSTRVCSIVLRTTDTGSEECRGIKITATGQTSMLKPSEFDAAGLTDCKCQ